LVSVATSDQRIHTHDLKSLSCNSLDLNSSFHYPSSSQLGCYYLIRKHQWHSQTNDPEWNKTHMFWYFLSSNYSSRCMFLFLFHFKYQLTAKTRMHHRKASLLRTSQPLRHIRNSGRSLGENRRTTCDKK